MKVNRRGFLKGFGAMPLAVPVLGMAKLPEAINEPLEDPDQIDLKPGDLVTTYATASITTLVSACGEPVSINTHLWEVSTVIEK